MNHKHLITLALIVFGSVLYSAKVWSQAPPIEIRIPDNTATIEYKPFSGIPANETLKLEFAVVPDFGEQSSGPLKADQERRLVSVRIRPSVLGPFAAIGEGNKKLPITVNPKSNSGRFNYFNDEYRHDFHIKPFSGESQMIEYRLSIPPSIFATAGLYELPLYIGVVDVKTGAPLSDLLELQVSVIVEPRLQVNIAGAQSISQSGAHMSTIDFGELQTGESRRVFIQVRGNAPAVINISSENEGKLQAPDDADMKINYSVLVDNEASELATPLSINRSVAQSLRGSSYPMTVKVGEVEGAFSGAYQDIITVEVRPQ